MRIIFDIILILLCLVAPWWVVLVLGIIGVILFPWYCEIVIAGALFDGLFGVPGPWYFYLVHTALFTVPLVVGEYIKRKINV